MGEQKPLHTYLYSFCIGDIPNLFVFLWSGFTYLGLDDWGETKKEWSRALREGGGEMESTGIEKDRDRERLGRGSMSSIHTPYTSVPTTTSIFFTHMLPKHTVQTLFECRKVGMRGLGVPARWRRQHITDFKARSAEQ